MEYNMADNLFTFFGFRFCVDCSIQFFFSSSTFRVTNGKGLKILIWLTQLIDVIFSMYALTKRSSRDGKKFNHKNKYYQVHYDLFF